MIISPQVHLTDYFCNPTMNKTFGNLFISQRMKYYKWIEIYRCLDFDVDELLELVLGNIRCLWKPSDYIAIDESW